MNESDPRSDVHYLGSSENKAWKKFIPRLIQTRQNREHKKKINNIHSLFLDTAI